MAAPSPRCARSRHSVGIGDWLQADAMRGDVLRVGVHGANSLGLRHPELIAPQPASWFRLPVLGDAVAFPADGFIARSDDNHRFLHQLTDAGGWLITEDARRALLPEDGGVIARIARWSCLALEARRLVYAHRPEDKVFPCRGDPAFAATWRADTWPFVDGEILRMRDVAAAHGARFAVVAVPYEPQLSDVELAADRAHAVVPQALPAALCDRAGIAFLDLHGAFASARNQGLGTDGYLTARGHEVAATSIMPLLRAHGLLRWTAGAQAAAPSDAGVVSRGRPCRARR